MLLANQILLILYIYIKPNVWYSWSLEILAIKRWFLVNFVKILQGRHFVVGGPKTLKLLADIFCESSLQNTVLSSLLLILCACYQVDLDDIQWNEAETSTARSLSNSWPLHLTFSNMINLCPNSWFIKNSKCQQYFVKKEPSKKHKFFILLKGRYFVMCGPIDMMLACFDRLLWAF